MREIGAMNRDNIKSLLSSIALYPFTQRLRMEADRFESLVVRARQEADTPNLKAYFPLAKGRVTTLGRQATRIDSTQFLAGNELWTGSFTGHVDNPVNVVSPYEIGIVSLCFKGLKWTKHFAASDRSFCFLHCNPIGEPWHKP
ncbi:hypothetical protein BJX96DRAFT_80451 [Aspergillus floccosus]